MLKTYNPPFYFSNSDSDDTSSEEDSSSEDDSSPEVEDLGETCDLSRKERVDPLDERVWAESSKGHIDFPSQRYLVRKIPTPNSMTTAERRTWENMLGETTTVLEQIPIADPVLYVALYSTGEEPSEIDDYHWVFIVGPSHERADSRGTQSNMEPVGGLEYICRNYRDCQWRWLYNQRTIPLQSQPDLLARLVVAEVADLEMLQAVVLRWAPYVCMHAHLGWTSVKWIKNVLKDLEGERGCLGRRMDSFESVEAEGRWLAKIEEDKRKGFSLLDTRVSTRCLFKREGAAVSSIVTVDIAIKNPVLYVGVYAGARSPLEKAKYHWAFLVGPSNDKAESEGVRCGIDCHLDSNGRRTWSYNQTIVPLNRQPGLLVRMLLADIVDLKPFGEIIRDHNSTPTAERPGSMGEASERTSLAWVREKLEMLGKKPECFAYRCYEFCIFEWLGMKAAESLQEKRKQIGVPSFAQFTKICLVSDWKPPADDELKVSVKPDLTRGKPNTISRAVQIVTGVFGEDALETRRQLVEREKQAIRAKQELEERTRSKQSENATTLAKARKPQSVDKGGGNEEQMTMARRERARNKTADLPKLKKFEKNPSAKKNAIFFFDQSEDDEDVDEATETAVSAEKQGGTIPRESARVATAVSLLEMNELTRISGKNSVAEEAKTQSNDKDDSDEEVVEESDDDEDEDEEEGDEGDEQEEGKAKGNVTQKKVTGRPDDVQTTSVHVLLPGKLDRAIEIKSKERQKDEDSSDSEDEDEEEESEDDGNEDDDEDDDNKGDDDDDDEVEDEDDSSGNSEDDGSNKGEDQQSDKTDDEQGEDSSEEDEEDEGDDEDDVRADKEDKDDEDEKDDEDSEDEDEDNEDEDSEDEDEDNKEEDEDKEDESEDDKEQEEDDEDDEGDEEEDEEDEEEDEEDEEADEGDDEGDEGEEEEEDEEESAGPKTYLNDIPEISLSR